MLNDKSITFRCKFGSRALFTPQYMHDVAGMRQHQDYEEVSVGDDGEVTLVTPDPVTTVQRVPLMTKPLEAVAAPKRGPGRPRKS